MNYAIALKRGISSEIYKYRGTLTLWLLILAPAFVPIINFFIFLFQGDKIIQPDTNPWKILIENSIDPANFLFPFFVFILALFVNNIEYNSNTWKLIYTQSLSRTTIYLAKMKVYIMMLLFSLLLFAGFTQLVGATLSFIKPAFGFNKTYDHGFLYLVSIKMFLSSLGYASIHFWISQHSKSIIAPLGIGIAGIISFMILVQGWEYIEYHPYGYQIMSLTGYRSEDFNLWAHMKAVYLSLGLAFFNFFLAGWEQSRKRIV